MLLTFNFENSAPEAFQHLCPTCSNSLQSLSRRKVYIAKDYSHRVGLLFKKLFRVLRASCLLNKNLQIQSTTGFQLDLKYFTKEMIYQLSKENETPVSKSDLSQ